MKVRFNQSGYIGQSRSVNASNAEDEGKLPLTRAIKALRDIAKERQVKLSVAQAKQSLIDSWDGEWHHVGKFSKECNYYSIVSAQVRLGWIVDCPDCKIKLDDNKCPECGKFY